jgi:hypothetical protein
MVSDSAVLSLHCKSVASEKLYGFVFVYFNKIMVVLENYTQYLLSFVVVVGSSP